VNKMTHIPYSRSDSRGPASAFSEVEMVVHFGTQLCGPINCGSKMEKKSKLLSNVQQKGMDKGKLHLSLPGLTGPHTASYNKVQ